MFHEGSLIGGLFSESLASLKEGILFIYVYEVNLNTNISLRVVLPYASGGWSPFIFLDADSYLTPVPLLYYFTLDAVPRGLLGSLRRAPPS